MKQTLPEPPASGSVVTDRRPTARRPDSTTAGGTAGAHEARHAQTHVAGPAGA